MPYKLDLVLFRQKLLRTKIMLCSLESGSSKQHVFLFVNSYFFVTSSGAGVGCVHLL